MILTIDEMEQLHRANMLSERGLKEYISMLKRRIMDLEEDENEGT